MSFFKQHSYDIVRLYINQIGITIFSLFLYTAVGFVGLENDSLFRHLRLGVSVASIIFYVFLVYNVFWEIGAKDKIRVDGGKGHLEKNKGFLMAVFANIPNFVISVVTLILVLIYKIGGGEGFYSAFTLSVAIQQFHGAMYMGVIQAVTPEAVSSATGAINIDSYLLQSIIYVFVPAVSLLAVHFSYLLGTKERRIFSSGHKNNK